jgi:hypothetical protein
MTMQRSRLICPIFRICSSERRANSFCDDHSLSKHLLCAIELAGAISVARESFLILELGMIKM